MFMRRRLKEDDRGIALISVMITVMLSFLLSATIMRVSLLSYLQKGVAKQSTETFYENESFVDDIKMGVQQKVATAFANSSSKSQTSFLNNFKTALLSAGTPSASEKTRLETALKSFITNTDTLKVVSVKVDGEGGVLFKQEGDGEIVIKNVRIEYQDDSKDGYICNIKTDIRIKSPFYMTVPDNDGSDYSFVASNGAVIADGQGSNRNQWGSLRQNGNVYVGYTKSTTVVKKGADNKFYIDSATALDLKQYMSYWLTGDRVIINGDIKISNHSNLIFTGKSLTVRGTIYIDNQNSHLILASTNTKVLCKDIKINGSSISDTYAAPGSTSIKGLPIDFSGQDAARTTWDGVASSIAYYNGTTGQDGNTKGISSLGSTAIVRDSSLKPVPNVDVNGNAVTSESALKGSGEQYDYEYRKMIDVVAVKNMTSPQSPKEPKLYAKNYTEDSNGKYKNMSGPDACSQHEDPTVEGKKCRVNVGTDTQKLHDGETHMMFNTAGDMIFDQLNNSGTMAGVFISTGGMRLNKAGGLTTIKSVVEMYGNDINKAKKALGFIGSGCMSESNLEKYCINNLFRGGIKNLLNGGSTGTGQTTTHDETKNKSLEVVTFENWEKY